MFRTERLWAEPLTEAHFGDLLRFHADPQHQAFLGGLRDEVWTRAYLDRNLEHWRQHGFGLYMLRLEQTGPVIGRGLLRYLPMNGVNEVEIGYSFVPDLWGQGLGTEIARGCLDQGWSRGFSSMVAVTLPHNVASRHVLEKAGLRYERDVVHADLPHVLYRTTADGVVS